MGKCQFMLFFLFIAVVLQVSLIHSALILRNRGLYKNSHVFNLNSTNFADHVFNDNKKLWIVEFYMDWCGDCQRFVPIWKEVAKNISEWRDVIVTAAINCANDNNVLVCANSSVGKFPNTQYFFNNISKHFLDEKGSSNIKPAEIIEKVTDVLIDEQRHRKDYSNWPDLAYFGGDIKQLLQTAPATTQYGFLIFEEPESRLGAEVILDLHKRETILIRRTTLNNYFEKSSIHSIIVVDRSNETTSLNILDRTREGVISVINEFLKSKNVSSDCKEAETYSDDDGDDEVHEDGQDKLYQLNIDSALYKVLKNDVLLQKEISGDKLTALRTFFKVVDLYFPMHSPQAKQFFKALKAFTENNNLITNTEFHKEVKEEKLRSELPFSEDQIYVTCKTYTCGLWLIFHTLTVKAAEYNYKNDADHPPVLTAMYEFVAQFFACRGCSEHFQEMSKEKDINRTRTPDEAILWLWDAHNTVNARLTRGGQLRPQYPTAESCSTCRFSNSTDDNISWNEPEVLKYLKIKYKSYEIKDNNDDPTVSTTTTPRGVDNNEATPSVNVNGGPKVEDITMIGHNIININK